MAMHDSRSLRCTPAVFVGVAGAALLVFVLARVITPDDPAGGADAQVLWSEAMRSLHGSRPKPVARLVHPRAFVQAGSDVGELERRAEELGVASEGLDRAGLERELEQAQAQQSLLHTESTLNLHAEQLGRDAQAAAEAAEEASEKAATQAELACQAATHVSGALARYGQAATTAAVLAANQAAIQAANAAQAAYLRAAGAAAQAIAGALGIVPLGTMRVLRAAADTAKQAMEATQNAAESARRAANRARVHARLALQKAVGPKDPAGDDIIVADFWDVQQTPANMPLHELKRYAKRLGADRHISFGQWLFDRKRLEEAVKEAEAEVAIQKRADGALLIMLKQHAEDLGKEAQTAAQSAARASAQAVSHVQSALQAISKATAIARQYGPVATRAAALAANQAAMQAANTARALFLQAAHAAILAVAQGQAAVQAAAEKVVTGVSAEVQAAFQAAIVATSNAAAQAKAAAQASAQAAAEAVAQAQAQAKEAIRQSLAVGRVAVAAQDWYPAHETATAGDMLWVTAQQAATMAQEAVQAAALAAKAMAKARAMAALEAATPMQPVIRQTIKALDVAADTVREVAGAFRGAIWLTATPAKQSDSAGKMPSTASVTAAL
eukprot:gnl/TRDRNA2_/TRDRNA2_49551_c0_seq2.p1 gnl/TRDRNA2_/TRDRNA2_49551_c0~~gnl/TRDRNA2_/TRDRNA2_49551_c0_seq2.p1  ORF type:complete len:626 (+),score=149.42 gnl/TRDRNA2_/TRDRNA2_49551_c0_seq2:35-1879(+)